MDNFEKVGMALIIACLGFITFGFIQLAMIPL